MPGRSNKFGQIADRQLPASLLFLNFKTRKTQVKKPKTLQELDTPALLVDLDLVEANIADFFGLLNPARIAVRPHLKTVKSPRFAQLLLQAGAVGGCVAKLGEAEVMAAGGIKNLLLTTELIGEPKLQRLIKLLTGYPDLQLRLVVDSLAGAIALNQALEQVNLGLQVESNGATPQNTRLQVEILLDINVGQNRTGVEAGQPALELAAGLKALENLRLVGVQGYEGHLQHIANPAEKTERCRAALASLTATADLLRHAGHNIEVVTTGGTGTALICAAYPGITEVQPGSFIFMDTAYRDALGLKTENLQSEQPALKLANALTVVTTVISRPAPNRAVVDAGLKALSTDSGFAEPKGILSTDGSSVYPYRYRPGGDEHGIIEWDNSASILPELQVGDRLELIPSHIDTTVNLHDYYYLHRQGEVIDVWEIAARGKIY